MEPHWESPIALRVFCIPELARLICEWVRKHDRTTMMRVCRQLHSSVVPFVWEQIFNLSVLLKLLPRLKITLYKPGFSDIKTMRLPSTPDLTRFNIYAPHVKSILLAPGLTSKCENCDGLYSISRSTTLLPNLSKIFLMKSELSDQQFLMWTTMFLSPSMNDVWSTGQRWSGTLGVSNWINLEQTSDFLHRIASACPGLKSLDIFPTTLPDNIHLDRTHSFFGEFRRSVRSFRCLRELCTNTLVLEQVSFQAIGEIPTLESLSIYPRTYYETVGSLRLPEDAFPALRRLNLQVMNLDSMVQLCGLKPLVWQLTTLGVLPQPSYYYLRLPDLCLAKPMSVLAKHNSILSSLLIDKNASTLVVPLEVDPALLQQFKYFPLKKVTLSMHTLSPELTLQNLIEVLPVVEELSLTHVNYHATELKQLRQFACHAKLPNLRNLEIGVDFESVRNLSRADFGIPQSQSCTCIQLRCRFDQVGKNKNLAKPVARFLHILWPNVTCSIESRLGNLDSEEGNEGMRLINAELFALRQKVTLK